MSPSSVEQVHRGVAEAALLVDPGTHEEAAVVVDEVGTVVLERWIPDRDGEDRVGFGAIDEPSEVALDVVDEVPTPGEVLHPSLTEDEIGERRVINLQDVARAIGQVGGGSLKVRKINITPEKACKPGLATRRVFSNLSTG